MHNVKIKHLWTEQQNRKSQNHCWHWARTQQGTELQAALCYRCIQHSLHVSPHISAPFSWFTFCLSRFTSGWYSWIPPSQQAGAISQKQSGHLEVEQTCGCASSFMGRMEGLEYLCLWVRCCETLCTLLQGVTLQLPKGVVLKSINIHLQSGTWLQADEV